MPKKNWELFEENATEYLNSNIQINNFSFVRLGGANSNASDISVYYKSQNIFNIECKLNKSQAAQAVVKADDKEYVSSDVPKTEELKKAETKETGSSSVKEQLKELKSLYDEKLISKAVYDQKQKDIIDKM